jgi:hypothetical protein
MKKFSLRISRQFKTDFITVEIRSEAKTINAAKQEVFDEFSAIPLFADHQELLAGTSKESVEAINTDAEIKKQAIQAHAEAVNEHFDSNQIEPSPAKPEIAEPEKKPEPASNYEANMSVIQKGIQQAKLSEPVDSYFAKKLASMPDSIRNATATTLAKNWKLSKEELEEAKIKAGKDISYTKLWLYIYKQANACTADFVKSGGDKDLAIKLNKLLKDNLEPEKIYKEFGEINEEKITSFLPF